MSSEYLIDQSAFGRIPTEVDVRAALAGPMADGRIAVCGVLRLEAGVSARTGDEHQRLRVALDALPNEPVLPEDFARAEEVQFALARLGQHRGVSLPDLINAAVAERSGRTVLHYDKDYDAIAGVTKQRTEWIVLRGSL